MIRASIRAMPAYQVQNSTGMVKLDAMENPYPLSASLQNKWLKQLAEVPVNRYPDSRAQALKASIAARDGLKPGQVLLGNGSDEIIQMLLIAADKGTCVIPEPTFVMYALISHWLNRPVATVPLDSGFRLDAGHFLKVCARENACIAFLACPNNPTGNAWPRETICEITENFHGLIIIDEAYAPFATRTHVDLIAENILILRTFSKLGWAGLRLGYILGHPETISQLEKVRLPYNINALTQATARFFLNHYGDFDKQIQSILGERKRIYDALGQLVQVFPSQTNFLLFRVADADHVHQCLREKRILIRNMHPSGGLLKNCLRVTIGLPEENDRFLSVLSSAIKAS